MEEFLKKAIELLTTAGSKILLALVVYIIGKWVIKKIVNFVSNMDAIKKLDPSVHTFTRSLTNILLNIVLVIAIISILGIPMTSVITLLASAGVAVGLALQGSLANLAGGLMLMIFRPFNVGDYVEATGVEGFVHDITPFYTNLVTKDKRKITIPNGSLMNSNVVNYSTEEIRVVDMRFSCGKDNDAKQVMDIIRGVMENNQKILKDPAPFVSLCGGTDTAMEFAVKPSCVNDDYWDVFYAMNNDVVEALSKAGIKAPAARILTDK